MSVSCDILASVSFHSSSASETAVIPPPAYERIHAIKGKDPSEDEYRGILHTRRHLAATPIFKGIPDFRQTRIAMLRANTLEELLRILEECRQLINN